MPMPSAAEREKTERIKAELAALEAKLTSATPELEAEQHAMGREMARPVEWRPLLAEDANSASGAILEQKRRFLSAGQGSRGGDRYLLGESSHEPARDHRLPARAAAGSIASSKRAGACRQRQSRPERAARECRASRREGTCGAVSPDRAAGFGSDPLAGGGGAFQRKYEGRSKGQGAAVEHGLWRRGRTRTGWQYQWRLPGELRDAHPTGEQPLVGSGSRSGSRARQGEDLEPHRWPAEFTARSRKADSAECEA